MSKSSQHIPGWVADWALIVAIVVIAVSFVNYGMSFLYPSPEYQDFCEREQYTVLAPDGFTNESACQAEGGRWMTYDSPRKLNPSVPVATSGTTTISGHCDIDYYCRQEYEAARDLHDRNGLLAMLIIGLAVAVLGFRRKDNDVIATAASISGIIIIISGLIRYWSTADDWAQFVLLGSLLLVFVYLAIRRSD